MRGEGAGVHHQGEVQAEGMRQSLDDMMCGWCGAEDGRRVCWNCSEEYAYCSGAIADSFHSPQVWLPEGYADGPGCPSCGLRQEDRD